MICYCRKICKNELLLFLGGLDRYLKELRYFKLIIYSIFLIVRLEFFVIEFKG